MLRPLFCTLFAFLAAPFLAAQTPLKAGDPLPPIVLEGLSQTEAASFSDFYGRTVLLEFFAFWCGPCAASVPHLNELQEKYGSRGFSVVAVTSENAKKTEPWIAKQGAKYAYGYDPKSALQHLFQFKGIPFAALIDPFGTVVWTGHPMALEEKEIEGALAGALERPIWQWPADLRPLAQLLTEGDYAAALELTQTLAPHEGFELPALVRGRFHPLIEKFSGLVEREEYPLAMELGARLEKGLASLPEGEPVLARMRALRDDPAIMRQVTATQKLAELEARASALRKPADAELLRTEVAALVAALLKEEAGQKVERRAKALLDALDRALERAKKKS